jgi:hypothetical protein
MVATNPAAKAIVTKRLAMIRSFQQFQKWLAWPKPAAFLLVVGLVGLIMIIGLHYADFHKWQACAQSGLAQLSPIDKARDG